MSAKVKSVKKSVLILLVVSSVISFFAFKPLVITAAKAQLRRTFPGSAVTVSGCSIKPDSLALTGITVENKAACRIAVKEASVRFSLFSLLSGQFSEAGARGITIDIRAPQKRTTELLQLVKTGSGKSFFSVGRVFLRDVDARISTKDAEAKAGFSIELDPRERTIAACELRIEYFRGYNLEITGADLSMRQKSENGSLTVQKVCYNNKLTATDIFSVLILKKEVLALNGLSARLLGGEVRGDGKLKLDTSLDYLVNLSVRGVSLDRVTGDLDLQKRVQMTGTLGGEIGLRGRGQAIQFLNADFSVDAPGGTLIITDAGFLDTIARGSQQYLEAVTESFKDYRYAEGNARAYKEGKDYVLEVSLDGEQGKRNFKITVGFKTGE